MQKIRQLQPEEIVKNLKFSLERLDVFYLIEVLKNPPNVRVHLSYRPVINDILATDPLPKLRVLYTPSARTFTR